MNRKLYLRDMFWFAVFHVGALVAVALVAGCTTGPMAKLGSFGKQDSSQAVADRQTRLQSQLGQARLHEQGERFEKARQIYQELALAFPQAAEPRHRLAVLLDRDKSHSEAQRFYLEALQLDPRNAQLHNDLGYSYFLSGNLTSARAMLEQAVLLDPANKLYHNNLGMTLGHLGMYQPALDQFVAAGGEDDAYYNLAFVYSTQQQFEQAKECFRRALQVNPRHERARLALESFERFEKNPEMSHDEMLAATEMSGQWRPYKEEGGVEQATFSEPAAGGSQAAANGSQALSEGSMAARQQLHARAQALLQRRMSEGGGESYPSLGDEFPQQY